MQQSETCSQEKNVAHFTTSCSENTLSSENTTTNNILLLLAYEYIKHSSIYKSFYQDNNRLILSNPAVNKSFETIFNYFGYNPKALAIATDIEITKKSFTSNELRIPIGRIADVLDSITISFARFSKNMTPPRCILRFLNTNIDNKQKWVDYSNWHNCENVSEDNQLYFKYNVNIPLTLLTFTQMCLVFIFDDSEIIKNNECYISGTYTFFETTPRRRLLDNFAIHEKYLNLIHAPSTPIANDNNSYYTIDNKIISNYIDEIKSSETKDSDILQQPCYVANTQVPKSSKQSKSFSIGAMKSMMGFDNTTKIHIDLSVIHFQDDITIMEYTFDTRLSFSELAREFKNKILDRWGFFYQDNTTYTYKRDHFRLTIKKIDSQDQSILNSWNDKTIEDIKHKITQTIFNNTTERISTRISYFAFTYASTIVPIKSGVNIVDLCAILNNIAHGDCNYNKFYEIIEPSYNKKLLENVLYGTITWPGYKSFNIDYCSNEIIVIYNNGKSSSTVANFILNKLTY